MKNYFRYADDFIIIHSEEDYLKDVLPRIAEFLQNELKLELHPNKVVIRKLRQGIDFLGYVVLPHYTALRMKTKRRMLKKLGIKYKKMEQGLIALEAYDQGLQSYLGILKHCEGYKIKKKINSIIELSPT